MTWRKYVEEYGYCPKCGETKGAARERRPNGNTCCWQCGWSPSKDWLPLETDAAR